MRRAKAVAALGSVVCATIALTVALSASVDWAYSSFTAHPQVAVLFPLVGLIAWLLYCALRVPFSWGTKHVIGNAECGAEVSARVVPAIFLGTCLTIAVGGSVGKEAAALQMGGGVAASVSKQLGLDVRYTRLFCACALASALSVLLGAPVAGAMFSVEVMQYRVRRVFDYVAIAASSGVAKAVSHGLSLDCLSSSISFPPLNLELVGAVTLLVLACAALSAAFCSGLSLVRFLVDRDFVRVPVLIVVGFLAAAFVLGLGGASYSGTGMAQVDVALAGELDGPYFVGKALFTLALLGAGYKGGEIMPTLCIGAAAGCCFGFAVGGDPSFMAAIALVAYFSACTNCPLASAALACEAFGIVGLGWFAFAAFAAYLPTYRLGFYENTSLYPELAKNLAARVRSVLRSSH